MKELLKSLDPAAPEVALARQIDPDRLPRHIAIIMDGNGRWARQRLLPRVAGHRAGVGSVRMATESCARMGIGALTLYAFSMENWKRPAAEVDTLWMLLRHYLKEERDTLMRNNVRLETVGFVEGLPLAAQEALVQMKQETAANDGLRLNLALNYSGRDEIVRAAQRLAAQNIPITENSLNDALDTGAVPELDLMIRTSGEMRLSNFLLWQMAYAELHVTPVYWPDFALQHLLLAVLDFQKRERRFGGIEKVLLAQ
jgi:undecaprenyl diphosphate synthase